MPAGLQKPEIRETLDRLYEDARGDDARDAAMRDDRSRGPLSHAEQSLRAETLYLPISRDSGGLMYSLVRSVRPETVVEFGMSFGISTIFLAAGVRDNGSGRVITSELSDHKVTVAAGNLRDAGVDEVVTILHGDARETLAELEEPIELVLLDGWKDLYLPVFKLLEPRLGPGTLVLADNSTSAGVADYLAYVRDPANGYESVELPIGNGVEISCRLGS